MKVIFAGTPHFAAVQLQALLQSPHEILAVLTQPDSPSGRGQKLLGSEVKLMTRHHPFPIYQPHTLKDPSIRATLNSLKADIMIVSAYGLILPQSILDLPRFGCINVHASLLPRWRGAAPIQHAILAGDKTTGVTIMQMTKGLDEGPMLLSAPISIQPNDTSASLTETLAQLGANCLLEVLSKYPPGPHPIPQNESFVTLAPKIKKTDAKINWAQPTTTIIRAVRAYNPWPVAYSELDETTIRIWQAQEQIGQGKANPPGTILEADRHKGLIVCTQDGALEIEIMQLPGKRKMPAKEVLKSQSTLFMPGERFKN